MRIADLRDLFGEFSLEPVDEDALVGLSAGTDVIFEEAIGTA